MSVEALADATLKKTINLSIDLLSILFANIDADNLQNVSAFSKCFCINLPDQSLPNQQKSLLLLQIENTRISVIIVQYITKAACQSW